MTLPRLPYTLHLGDCIAVMRTMADNSVDSIVTDPPYHLTANKKGGTGAASMNLKHPAGRARISTGFMGTAWDGGDIAQRVELWAEALRVLKPGGHLLAFSGSRTYHRMVCAIEDAGFEVRDQIMYLYASGMPKSLNVSKAIDKAAGTQREVVGTVRRWGANASGGRGSQQANDYQASVAGAEKFDDITAPATTLARKFEGWGTALKPSHEPICVARKPLIGTVAKNVAAFGTGGINIDACRVPTADNLNGGAYAKEGTARDDGWGMQRGGAGEFVQPSGRWPANVIHDGSDEVLAGFPVTKSGAMKHEVAGYGGEANTGFLRGRSGPSNQHGDAGSAARFFYCAKTSRRDRHEGMEDPGPQFAHGATLRKIENTATAGNNHPTVKPFDLMRYLCRLVTPPGGVVLDIFMGSGSTGKAAMAEGFGFVGIELMPEYFAIAQQRIGAAWQKAQDAKAEAA